MPILKASSCSRLRINFDNCQCACIIYNITYKYIFFYLPFNAHVFVYIFSGFDSFIIDGRCVSGKNNREYIVLKFDNCSSALPFYCYLNTITLNISSGKYIQIYYIGVLLSIYINSGVAR